MKRILALDCGIKHTGIVLADIDKYDYFEIIKFESYEMNDQSCFLKHIQTEYLAYMVNFKDAIILYEGLHTSRAFFKNWYVYHTHKKMIKMCKEHYSFIKTLTLKPSQKIPKQVGRGNNRKKNMVTGITSWLFDDHSWAVEQFNSYKRNHDIADAFGMIRYYATHMS